MNLFEELKRRHVFRIGIAYLVVAWLVLQVVNIVVPIVGAPDWTNKLLLILLVAGFPIALVLAWAFEMTPEGVKRTGDLDEVAPKQAVSTGRKLDFVIIGLMAIALAYFGWRQYYGAPIRQTAEQTTPGATATAAAMPSLAVLPFANLSADKNQEYFADGLSEELLNKLAGLKELRVIGRTSSFAFKGKNEDLRTIAETLGVNHLLEGSVRKSGNEVRITAQLIRAADGSHIWSKTYDRKLDDIFAIQDDISMAVADALQVTLGVGELAHQPGMTRNVAAYDEYLAAHTTADITPQALQSGIAHLEKAISIDPDFALAWQALSQAYSFAAGTIPDEVQGAGQKAFQAAERARKLAPDAPQVLAQQSTASLNRGDWQEADRLTKAETASDATTLAATGRGQFLYLTGRAREAVGVLERARSVDPLDPGVSVTLSQAYAATGNTAAALAEAERGLKVANAPPLMMTGAAFLAALATKDRAEIKKWLALMPVSDDAANVNVVMVGMIDDPVAALKELHRLAAEPRFQAGINRYVLSQWAAYFGDQKYALELFRDIADHSALSGQYGAWRPINRNMRKLPGFKDYLRKIGLVDYWRKSGNWGDFCHPIGDDDFECE